MPACPSHPKKHRARRTPSRPSTPTRHRMVDRQRPTAGDRPTHGHVTPCRRHPKAGCTPSPTGTGWRSTPAPSYSPARPGAPLAGSGSPSQTQRTGLSPPARGRTRRSPSGPRSPTRTASLRLAARPSAIAHQPGRPVRRDVPVHVGIQPGGELGHQPACQRGDRVAYLPTAATQLLVCALPIGALGLNAGDTLQVTASQGSSGAININPSQWQMWRLSA